MHLLTLRNLLINLLFNTLVTSYIISGVITLIAGFSFHNIPEATIRVRTIPEEFNVWQVWESIVPLGPRGRIFKLSELFDELVDFFPTPSLFPDFLNNFAQ